MKRLLVLCGLATLLAVPAASAKAAVSPAPTITSSANPIVLGTAFTWQGCGYQPGVVLRLATTMNGLSTGIADLFVDQLGCFVSSEWVFSSPYIAPGTEVATVYRLSPTIGKPTKELASTIVQVVAG